MQSNEEDHRGNGIVNADITLIQIQNSKSSGPSRQNHVTFDKASSRFHESETGNGNVNKLTGQLPAYKPRSAPSFTWGDVNGMEVEKELDSIYKEVVFWKKNLFLLPSGKVGKEFVAEMTRLVESFANATSLEGIAMKALVVFQVVVLQKPHAKSKSRDHIQCVQRRLELWKMGRFDDLVREGRTLQCRLNHSLRSIPDVQVARVFSRLVIQGKVNAALRYVSDNANCGVLSLDAVIDNNGSTVKDLLRVKHPEQQPLCDEIFLNGPVNDLSHVIFDKIDGSAIRSAALRTQGAGGPSGVDSTAWKRLCCSFQKQSAELCNALAGLARRICCDFVDPSAIQALVACRLIPLDKNPGLRPIGIGETFRRIIAKAIMRVIKDDVCHTAGPLQVCAGQEGGCEAAIHAMRTIFDNDETECVLLVDASNAFNCLNRRAALHNARILCPAIATVLINTYRDEVLMFVVGGEIIRSAEGTTQGDPLAMSMYAIGILPLITQLQCETKQVWYADDATGAGCIRGVRQWWNDIVKVGPKFGYHANAVKTWLIVKQNKLEDARSAFADTAVQITTSGKRHLGAALGHPSFVREYVDSKVNEWVRQVEKLSTIAVTHPHVAYSAFTQGLAHRWSYLLRTVPSISEMLKPLEEVIHQRFLPRLTGQPVCGADMRDLLSLPCNLGGLNISDPSKTAESLFAASEHITAPLAALIVEQENAITVSPLETKRRKSEIKAKTQAFHNETLEKLQTNASPQIKGSLEVLSEKGVSSWLTVQPIEEHGFHLAKNDFRDALCLRYGWPLSDLPSKCECGLSFNVDHVMICQKGGFPTLRHNEIRNITADLLREVSTDVTIEPVLRPLDGEQFAHRTAITDDNARVDISARGVWRHGERAFFDVRVFYPNAASNRKHSSLKSAYVSHENEKKRAYGERIREVEHGSFTPLVFTSYGSTGPEATTFYKRVASLHAAKSGEQYSRIMQLIRCRLSFALLRSSILCIRGTRSSTYRPIKVDLLGLIESEAHLDE